MGHCPKIVKISPGLLAARFFNGSNLFSNLGNGSHNDNFHQIIFKSSKQNFGVGGGGGGGGVVRFLKVFLLVAMATRILHGIVSLNNFERGPPKDSCEVW